MVADTRPLLILDLDETLLFGTRIPLDRSPDLEVHPYLIYRRPHLGEFIATLRREYRLAVWTSATFSYAAPIVVAFFPADLTLEFFWCRDRCTWCRDPENQKEYWLKNLKKVARLGHDLDRTLFVDDKAVGLRRNYGNHVGILPYGGAIVDDELPRLARFLVRISASPNLRAIEKRLWRAEGA